MTQRVDDDDDDGDDDDDDDDTDDVTLQSLSLVLFAVAAEMSVVWHRYCPKCDQC